MMLNNYLKTFEDDDDIILLKPNRRKNSKKKSKSSIPKFSYAKIVNLSNPIPNSIQPILPTLPPCYGPDQIGNFIRIKDNKYSQPINRYFTHLTPENLDQTKTLYIEGLYIGITEEEVRDIIIDNNIKEIRLANSKNGKRQLCFIEFETIEQASIVLRKFQGMQLKKNRYLRITYSNTTYIKTNKQ